MRLRAVSVLLLACAVIWVVPLLGTTVTGHPLQSYLGFPPRSGFLPHAPFNWSAFVLLALPIGGAVALYWVGIANAQPRIAAHARHRFPWWGILGGGLIGVSWYCAWYDRVLSQEWQRHTFTPLWLGYILAMNGLAFQNTGWAPLTHRTRWFLTLFPVSAGFWWLFEYLNQFIGSWYYSETDADGDWDYFIQATLPFCTVLPAVASTWAWLRSFSSLEGIKLPPIGGHNALTWFAFGAGLLGLLGIGLWPDILFAALWIGPLLILLALQQLLLGQTLFHSLEQGDWRSVLQPALAALICGLLWELWNFGSAAKWHYSIPYVQRFSLFEMPLLGYGGYLPFGIECALVMDLVAWCIEGRSVWPLDSRADATGSTSPP